MAHDRNEKQEEHEESEYHFSDDEVSYEVETEPTKTASTSESKKNFLTQLSGSKRLIASAAVFFVLIIVIYKMLSPSSPSTPDIVPVASVTEQPQPRVPERNPPPAVVAHSPSVVPVQVTTTTQTVSPYGTGSHPSTPMQSMQPGQANGAMPNNASNGVPTQPTLNEGSSIGMVEARISSMATENEKRLNQLYTDYTQKLNDYAVQNKQLQDQVQLLTTKISSLEVQMSQLMQVMMHQGQANNAADLSQTTTSSSQPKVPYNVQAIIPGRAWLKADNGETVTVAEGDLIKGLGRVTKIDPYDGIVEVNTGNKAVSLSYGSGG